MRVLAALCAFITVSTACGCGLFGPSDGSKPAAGTPHESAAGIADRNTSDKDKIVNFAKNSTSDFRAAHGYRNGAPFNCTWNDGNAVIENGIMNMSVTEQNGGYLGAEYRSDKTYSYGYYSVSMKAAACSGVISSFFTYTHNPKWDEIDIEFLGKDTTKVQFNYYTDGTGGHEYVHELGFDASKGFHEYGFDWQENYITWYVDGKAIYKATEKIPSAAGKIMANVWNGEGEVFDNWCGKLNASGLPATASYLWFAYSGNEQAGEEEQKPVNPPSEKPSRPIGEDKFTAEADKIAVFSNGDSPLFHKADGWSNGDMFNCTWRGSNINFDGGNMNISITNDYNGGYAGGEYRTNDSYHFGYYSVSMKPAKCDGIVSSFFTYTDKPRWDEIDIEFLGKDTTKVQFNYYTNGVGNHEFLYDLGFDASKEFHEYGFEWKSDGITWYVDGKAVYKATENVPQYAGKIMANVWNGIGVDDWLDPFDPSRLPVTAQYKWIGYKAL